MVKHTFVISHELELYEPYSLSKRNSKGHNAIPTISHNIDVNQNVNDAIKQHGEEDEDDRERDQWTKPVEFLLSCIASSVGLGNVWRFPFTAYKNGGGAFLIPYLIILLLIGRPLYFMELSLGQFCSYGSVKVWKCVPILKGIGIGQAISTFYVITYYVVLAATCVFYLASCFQSELPWSKCDSEWADCRCYDQNSTQNISLENCTVEGVSGNLSFQSAAEQYNQKYVFQLSSGFEDMGMIDWRLALCLLLCWIVLFLSVIKGVKSSGKTAYFTALFPYVVLIALLIVGVQLDGAVDGIIFFLKPDWEKILDIWVWYKACEQMLFSLTVGYGVLVVYSSYNGFKHPVYRDAMIISVLDLCTSMLAGLTIFSIIGALAYDMNVSMDEVVKGDSALAFIAYPEALARINVVPQLWAALFFIMMLTLAIGTTVGDVNCLLTILQDQLPGVSRWKILLCQCVVAYCMGLVYITNGGQYALNLVDSLGAGFSSFIFAIGECLGLMFIYGLPKFVEDISFMLGFKLSIYWKATWGLLSPLALTAIFIYSMVSFEPLSLGDYMYPKWAEGIGWGLASIAIIQIPLWAVISVWQQEGATITEKFRKCLVPTSDWGPKNRKDKREWLAATEHRNNGSTKLKNWFC